MTIRRRIRHLWSLHVFLSARRHRLDTRLVQRRDVWQKENAVSLSTACRWMKTLLSICLKGCAPRDFVWQLRRARNDTWTAILAFGGVVTEELVAMLAASFAELVVAPVCTIPAQIITDLTWCRFIFSNECKTVLTVTQCGFFKLILICNGKNSLAGYFSVITDVVFFLLSRHHHTTANASPPTLTRPTTQRRRHILTHTNTYLQITHFQHRCRPTSFQVARGLHSYARTVLSCTMRTRSGPRPTNSDTQVSQSRVYTEKEPTRRVIIVIVVERGERRQERAERREREKRKRRDERKREKTTIFPSIGPDRDLESFNMNAWRCAQRATDRDLESCCSRCKKCAQNGYS